MTKKRAVIIGTVIALMLTCYVGVAWYMSGLRPNAVLMYHCISEPPQIVLDAGTADIDLYVTPAEFEAQLKWLKSRGYRTGFASDHGEARTALLTFDDGYADFYTNAYPLLQKYDMKATVFLIVSMIGRDGYLSEEMIREMSDSGLVEFHSHTMLHTKLDTISGELIWYELAESKRRIETITGREVYAICYPNGAYNAEVLKAASQLYTHGFTTIAPKRYDEVNKLAIRRCGVGYGYTEEEFISAVKSEE